MYKGKRYFSFEKDDYMKKIKIYTFAIMFLCFSAISSSIECNQMYMTTAKTVEQAHNEVFNTENQNEKNTEVMKMLVFGD